MKEMYNYHVGNDQKLSPCYFCKKLTKSQIYYCIEGVNYEAVNDEVCEFNFRLCKAHKNKTNKVFREHYKEHESVDIS